MSQHAIAYKKPPLGKTLKRDFQLHMWKYLLILPVLVYLAIFCYKPMYGLIIAFKNYKPVRGIWGSRWVGFQWFETFFKDPYFFRLLCNTFRLSAYSILFGFPAPIILALLLNEVTNTKFKRTVQTITYMPYFISLVVTCSLIRVYCQSDGLFSKIGQMFGAEPQNLLTKPEYFTPIYVISGIWQNIGWNSILYLAALSGIDQELYEAARIDGASRFKQVLHVTIPGILPTIMVMFILRMGSILGVGYEKIILLYNETTFQTADVFSTYTYRIGLQNMNYSLSTAVGLFNTLVNVLFLMFTNFLSKKTTESGLF